MPALQFKAVYKEMILTGRKTQTLRAVVPRGVRESVTLTFLNGYRPGAKFATAQCTAVDVVHLDDLTEEDATVDGFATLADLRQSVRKLYGDSPALYRIRWSELSAVRQ